MKFELITPETIQIRESTGIVKDIYDPVNSVREPLSAYNTMLDLIHRSPTLSRAYDIIAEFATYRGFDFIGGDEKTRNELRELFDETLNFKQVLPNMIYSLFYYGDCFLELRKNNSKTPNELWPLETTEMRIIFDTHGKIEGFVQRPYSLSGLTESQAITKESAINPDTGETFGIFWKPDEVIHFRMKWIGSQVYSYNPNESISQAGSTNLYAGNYLMNIFLNMPPKYVAHLAGVNKSDYESAKKEFQSTKTNYKKTIVFSRSNDPQSQLSLQKIESPIDENLLKVKSYLENEMLKITGVPRTWVEKESTENRGVGESLHLPFEIKLQYLHRVVLTPLINHKLMKALGYYKKRKGQGSKVKFSFNEVSRKGEKEILMNAGLLRDMGLKPKALVRYLDERGILGLDPNDFEIEQIAKNMELNDSRARENKATDNMKSKIDSDGVSAAGAKKMESET